jgi:hypothetical protein
MATTRIWKTGNVLSDTCVGSIAPGGTYTFSIKLNQTSTTVFLVILINIRQVGAANYTTPSIYSVVYIPGSGTPSIAIKDIVLGTSTMTGSIDPNDSQKMVFTTNINFINPIIIGQHGFDLT